MALYQLTEIKNCTRPNHHLNLRIDLDNPGELNLTSSYPSLCEPVKNRSFELRILRHNQKIIGNVEVANLSIECRNDTCPLNSRNQSNPRS